MCEKMGELAEVYRSLLELYRSKDFLLNISAEAIGVLAEVILVSLVLAWFINRRDLRNWQSAFFRRIRRALELHKELPKVLVEPRFYMGTELPAEVMFTQWGGPIEEFLKDALALVPPTLENSEYLTTEHYYQGIQQLFYDFHNENKVEYKVLEAANGNAAELAKSVGLEHQETYVWSTDQLRDIHRILTEEAMRLSSSHLPKKKPTKV